ncbi:MAG: DUF1501 domain-containing protein [Gammaproteobacteria bacterium]|nr:DUF1501 domain-containing protein [Gammaproteobacteria bacterium]
MKRRTVCKSLGVLGGMGMLGGSIFNPVRAASLDALKGSANAIRGEIAWTRPTTMPQALIVFLYGGASELAGNLSNIDEINATSQNPYSSNLLHETENNIITPNDFWGGGNIGAGGEMMENMIAGNRMSVYRTLNRTEDDTKAHRPSIFSNLTGMIGEDNARPGIATTLAAVLYAHGAINDESLFPFVTLEGESVIFNKGDVNLPLAGRPISLDERLDNPYSRVANRALETSADATIEALANSTSAMSGLRYEKIMDSFNKRSTIANFITDLNQRIVDTTLPNDPDTGLPIEYPNNSFGRRMRQAVNIVSNNPDTMFVSVGSGGLGGWDDHDSALEDYPARMRSLMRALDTASKHLDAIGKRNVPIFVFSDFGRNVNLNNSLGWDHGNNQTLYTVSGSAIAGRQLGKIIGKTKKIGTPNENRQFTSPTDDSYQAPPFSVAATLYKYYGIENPQDLTGGVQPLDENAPNEYVSGGS